MRKRDSCHRFGLWALGVGLLIVAGGCDSADTTAGPIRAPEINTAASAGLSGEGDLYIDNAFEIDVRVTGSLKPGEPVHIEANVRAKFADDNAEIKIVAPEIQAALRSGWDDTYQPNMGEKVPPSAHARGGMQAGGAKKVRAKVKPASAGYYRIVVSANTSKTSNPHIQGDIYKEIWLLIAEDGGKVTQLFDPKLVPQEMRKQPGPWRRQIPSRLRESAIHHGALANNSSSSGNDYHRIEYFNNHTNLNEPLPGVSVDIYVYGWVDGSLQLTNVIGFQADANGVVTIPCAYVQTDDYYDVYVSFVTPYAMMTYPPAYGITAFGSSCGSYHTSANPGVAVMLSNVSHVLKRLSQYAGGTQAFFGQTRGVVNASAYGTSGTSSYSQSSDHIEIYSNTTWGAAGDFVIAHEYGHAFHEKGLGGYQFPSGCSSHRLDQQTNLGCAFVEGFANYFAITTGSAIFDAETHDYTYGCISYSGATCVTWSSTRDGSVVEAAVAQFFYDLTDAANETHDAISYPGSYVADLIETCNLSTSGGGTEVNGVDHMVYCLELQVDATVRANYFTTRSGSVQSITSESATEPASWSATNIRDNWLYTLYRQ